MHKPLKALIIVTVWPEPESSAAGWRVLNVIDALREDGWSVTLASPSRENEFSDRLRRSGVEVQPVQINDPSFDEWVASRSFDLAILDRFVIEEQFGWRIDEHSPKTVRVLDTEDLHFLRRARGQALAHGVSLEEIFDDQIDLFTEDACREIASIYRSDLALILSDHEMQLLKSRFRVDPERLHSFRFCYRDFPETPGYDERRDFAVIGNFRHPPNADGTHWLKKELWPRIRALLPEEHRSAQVHVYGSYPSREAMNLSSPAEGFIVKGPASDVHETLRRYRVNLAPLRFGAGIKGKISDGWRAGAPVVTTPIGAEGMIWVGMPLDGEPPAFGGRIARNPDDFAAKAALLYTDRSAWEGARETAAYTLRELFDFSRNAKDLTQTLRAMMTHIQSRRERNFVGKMLSHHTLRSTKYFSRWIELKERTQK